MKKIKTTLVVGMVFLSTYLFGQATDQISEKIKNEETPVRTYLDVMVNMVSTNFYYGEQDNSLSDFKKVSRGLQAGFAFQKGLTRHFSIVSELYYVQKGGILKTNNPLTTFESSIRLNTIEMPLLARIHFGHLYLNAGPSVGYNFSGTRKMHEESSKIEFSNSVGSFTRFDFGVQCGLGIEIPMKQKQITIDFRYVHGLTNVIYDQKMQSRALMISVRVNNMWAKKSSTAKHN